MVETYHLDLRTALKRKLGGLGETSSITEDRCCSWGHAGERTHHTHHMRSFNFALFKKALKRNIEGLPMFLTFYCLLPNFLLYSP